MDGETRRDFVETLGRTGSPSWIAGPKSETWPDKTWFEKSSETWPDKNETKINLACYGSPLPLGEGARG